MVELSQSSFVTTTMIMLILEIPIEECITSGKSACQGYMCHTKIHGDSDMQIAFISKENIEVLICWLLLLHQDGNH